MTNKSHWKAVKSELKSMHRLMKEREKRYTQLNSLNQEALKAALSTAKEAKIEVQRSNDKWQANANEWRGTMDDKDRNFVTKNALWGYFVAVMALSIAFATLVVRTFGGH